ncbi:MAG: hypothetical protein JWM41_3957 [Gemmatimonadetes bacterium]|nr:hypothetical protein [Gemmatimonadota bacterium]
MQQLGFLDVLGLSTSQGMVVLCAIIAVGIGFLGAGAWLVGVDLVLFAVYLVIALTPAMSGPAARWVRDDPASSAPADAVIVLSGGLTPDSSLGTSGTERLLSGLELVRAGVAPRIVTTRVTQRLGGRQISSDPGQRRLIGLAGMDSAWSMVDSVHSTRDEAMQVARLLRPAAGRSIVVVTSAMHTRRACAVFEGVGFHVRCVAARGLQNTTRRPISPDDRLEAFREYLYEHLGMLKYRWKGWIKPGPATL